MNYNVYQLTRGEADEREDLMRKAELEGIRKSPNIFWLPGGLKLIKECRGCFYLACITAMWAYNSVVIPTLVLVPMHHEEQLGGWVICVFIYLSTATIMCLLRSCLSDPGYIPFENMVTSPDSIHWSHCKKCLIQRPLKSHHCRRCQRCVRRMDHHCPWINSCVGEDNQWLFVLLVFYGFLLSCFALLLDVLHFYYFKPCTICDKDSYVFQHERYLMYGCFASGVMLATFCFNQLFTQLYNISKDKTTVESLIYAQKPIHERPPLKKTPLESFRDVFGRGPMLLWLNPLRRRRGPNIVVYPDLA